VDADAEAEALAQVRAAEVDGIRVREYARVAVRRRQAGVDRLFEAAGVNAGPINTIAEVAADSHIAALGVLRPLVSERWGREVTVVDTPITFDGQVEHGQPGDPPLLGEHNESILAELGYPPDAIAAFAEAGVIRAVEAVSG